MKILIGVTGSVATIKLGELLSELRSRFANVELKIVVTERGNQFVTLSDLPESCYYRDEQEWTSWKQKGDSVLHIELRKWADLFVICPLSANTLAKMAVGMCDNLLTSIVRAWPPNKPLVVCPAMNTCMWENPLTAQQIKTVQTVYRNCSVVMPKEMHILACGDVGPGALASITDIVDCIQVNIHV